MKIKVAAIQLPGNPQSLPDRLAAIESQISCLASQEVKLAVLPEMGMSGYDVGPDFPQGEPIPGPLSSWLEQQSKKYSMVLIAGMAEAAGCHIYNVSVVTDPRGYCGKYRKIHVSTVENASWNRGVLPCVIETVIGRIAVGICADMVFPALWEFYHKQKPDLVAISAAWPDFEKSSHPVGGKTFRDYHRNCVRLLPEKISEFVGAPVIFSNCSGPSQITLPYIGKKIDCQFAGGSRVVEGTTIHSAQASGIESVAAEVETGALIERDPVDEQSWLPGASWRVCRQFYLGESLSTLLFRGVYRYRRILRRATSNQ